MKSITKTRLKEVKRLINLESEMATIVKKSKKKLTVKDLKGYFDGRASINTTIGILKVSDTIGMLTAENVGTRVTVTYSISGINLKEIYIGGDGSTRSSGTLSNVIMNADDSIELQVYQNSPINQQFSFGTTYIGNINTEFIQITNPLSDSNEFSTILTRKQP